MKFTQKHPPSVLAWCIRMLIIYQNYQSYALQCVAAAPHAVASAQKASGSSAVVPCLLSMIASDGHVS